MFIYTLFTEYIQRINSQAGVKWRVLICIICFLRAPDKKLLYGGTKCQVDKNTPHTHFAVKPHADMKLYWHFVFLFLIQKALGLILLNREFLFFLEDKGNFVYGDMWR